MSVVYKESLPEVPTEAYSNGLPAHTSQPGPALQLLVELPSRRQMFLSNLRDFIFPRPLPPLALRSAPAPFWHDVFVPSGTPWNGLLKSAGCHIAACAALIAFSHLLALEPHVVPQSPFEHSSIVYPSESLPPLDTRRAQAAQPSKPDPELSRQPVISVPREADNRIQTIVTPPQVKLKTNVALPNMIAWSDSKLTKPQLAIQPAPLTLAADISRIQPQLNSVVAPPPDASHLVQRRDHMDLQAQVVAPPPAVLTASNRRGDITIAPSAVIAPAPALAVADQQSSFQGPSSSRINSQVVPPPPSQSASGSFGAQGRVVALNLHPAVGAPPTPPAGNRRGTFAAAPAGRAGASGTPGSAGGSARDNGSGIGSKSQGNLPSGLYVGSAGKTSAVAGDSVSANSANPASSVRPSRVTTAPSHAADPENAAKLSEPERAVFGGRKFYSLSLSMPNFNSAGGTWIIRFAEMSHDTNDSPHPQIAETDATPPASDFSQPQAIRKVDPAYPQQLMQENVAGTVILYAVIHADGTVGNVRVLRSVDSRLDRFASEAVAQWKFNPGTKEGSPVDVEATFHIPFRPAKIGTSF